MQVRVITPAFPTHVDTINLQENTSVPGRLRKFASKAGAGAGGGSGGGGGVQGSEKYHGENVSTCTCIQTKSSVCKSWK